MSTLDRMWRRVLLLVGRGRVTLVDDSGPVQRLQMKLGAEEIKDGVPRLAEYGFQSMPPVGSDAVLVFLAGERSNGVAIACGNQTYRLKGLATGEVAISDDKGQKVYLSAAGIRIDGGGKAIQITNAPSLLIDIPAVHLTGSGTIDGSLHVVGNITTDANVTADGNVADQGGTKTMAGMRTAYNGHHHGAGPTTDAPM
jgi:phage baseplate assembly protein V